MGTGEIPPPQPGAFRRRCRSLSTKACCLSTPLPFSLSNKASCLSAPLPFSQHQSLLPFDAAARGWSIKACCLLTPRPFLRTTTCCLSTATLLSAPKPAASRRRCPSQGTRVRISMCRRTHEYVVKPCAYLLSTVLLIRSSLGDDGRAAAGAAAPAPSSCMRTSGLLPRPRL